MNEKTGQVSILLIYTGGTIGMVQNQETGRLEPFHFPCLLQQIPEVREVGCAIETVQFDQPLDSADMGPESWACLARLIADHYAAYDGFVVLHGTDTMAYTASALSFMLENLSKPVILTGSQLPLGMLRTDGKENLLTALEIAAAREGEFPLIEEVCIFFENDLMRGNRTSKTGADNFNAFHSYNYPALAHAGVTIHYNRPHLYRPILRKPLKPHFQLDTNVALLKLFPGISLRYVETVLGMEGLKGVVLETYGSGNAPSGEWFVKLIREAVEKEIVVVNITQCQTGSVEMQRYETGLHLQENGVISGYDSTTEAAITKLMFLFGLGLTPSEVKEYMQCALAGEMSVPR